jgi:hypothetical protein
MNGYDVKKEDNNWKFEQHKSDRSIRNFDTKKEAVGFATAYMRAHEGSLKIKKANGRIQEERTYPRSKDPSRTPG